MEPCNNQLHSTRPVFQLPLRGRSLLRLWIDHGDANAWDYRTARVRDSARDLSRGRLGEANRNTDEPKNR